MFKIMKHEIIRNRSTLIALVGVLLCAEIVFLLGAIRSKGTTMVMGFLFLILATGASFFTVWIQGVTGFKRDLSEKSGYMIFMTPVSPYRIVVGRLLVALLELILASGMVALMFLINVKILYVKYETPLEIIELVARFLGVSMSEIWVSLTIAIMTSMLTTLTLYAAAHLFEAIWALNSGRSASGKGLVIFLTLAALVVFILIAVLLPNLQSTAWNPVVRGFIRKIPRYIFYLAGIVISSLSTGYLLKEKVSL